MIILLITICICNSVLTRCGKRTQFFTTYKPTWRCVLFLERRGLRRCGRHQAWCPKRHTGTRG
ncbi:hypothetical protein EHN13_10020 [Citrobacter youngae]|nr:hypothetical protein EHN13_10020 [Citrobacter youngae]